MNTRLAAIVTGALAILTIACGGSPAPAPASSAAAHRVISLVPACTEMLFAIGAGDAVVGVSSFDRYPPEVATRTSVGALIDPDFERILTLHPDLVVVYGSQKDLMQRLTARQIPMYSYVHAGLPDIPTTMRTLGTMTGHAGEAERAASALEADVQSVRRTYAALPHPKTALIIGRETGSLRGIFAGGGVGFLHDMLEAAGGVDAFADVPRENVQASTEMMLTRAPEVILELHATADWTPARLEQERGAWSTLTAIPAVRSGRIVELADDVTLVPGPRVADGIRLIAKAIH